MVWSKAQAIQRRHVRVRQKISGTAERPRLCIHRSLKHIYAQLIDDTAGKTLCSVTTNTKALKAEAKSFCNITWAQKMGTQVAAKAKEIGVSVVVFDRGGNRYHGVVRAFADAAREAGLKF